MGTEPGLPGSFLWANKRQEPIMLFKKLQWETGEMLQTGNTMKPARWSLKYQTLETIFKVCSSELTSLRNSVSLAVTHTSTKSVTST